MLKVENVSYSYKTKYQTTQAVQHVSCSFMPGVIHAITGRSGSGKSTLLSLLAGLDLPTDGSIYVDGEDMRNLNRDQYRRDTVSVIYQAFHLFPLLTILENITFPMEIQKKDRVKARTRGMELMTRMGLSKDYADKFPNMLSGGEQQRVAVARAVAAGGKIILADEPTGNLDSENEKNIIKLLRSLAHEDGFIVIVVTHNDAVADASDIVFEMHDGELTQIRGKRLEKTHDEELMEV